jgi:hypothetical protein
MQRESIHIQLRPALWVIAALALVVLVLAPAGSGGTDAKCWNCMPITPPPPGKVIGRVSFTAGKPRTWEVLGGSSVSRAGNTLSVRTGAHRFWYALAGPPLALSPGTYSLRLYGTVTDGGMTLGVIAAKRPWNFLSFRNYAAHQARMGQRPLGVSFKVEQGTKVRVVLANCRRVPQSSRWTLQRLSIVRNS